MKRRVATLSTSCFLGLALFACRLEPGSPAERREAATKLPNIVYILADDLGYAELGSYGQDKIETPHLDALAAAGMRFTQHYSGSPVCAPSRCVLLTGLHTGHSWVRDNSEMGGWDRDAKEGQEPLPEGTKSLATLLSDRGYRTGCVGKWGLGGPGSSGHPNRQGFDHYFGYLCQRIAHNYYPTHLWRNEEKVPLANEYFSAHQKLAGDPDDPASYAGYRGQDYAVDRMTEEALDFVREGSADEEAPFFLYLAYPIPHVALQVPEDSLAQYEGRFPETPYRGERAYLPHPTPRAAYAAMVTRMDRDIGRLLRLLEELGEDDNTLVIFSSDNGPTFNGGSDSEFFASTGGLRGLKCDVYEGGIRVPMIARWPGKIAPGTTSDHVSGFQDVLPTLAAVTGEAVPWKTDGLSFLPTLLGEGEQEPHQALYWEYAARGQQAVRMGPWKAVRVNAIKDPTACFELYHLDADLEESEDLAADRPDIIAKVHEVVATRSKPHIAKWEFPPPPE